MVVAREFWDQFARASRSAKSEAQRRLVRLGVHAGQQFVLECLWDSDGLTSGEIARQIGVEAATLTRALRRMEASGLIERRADEHDRRRVRTWLTPRGRELQTEVHEAMDQLARDVLALLSEEEQAALQELLGRMERALANSDSLTVGEPVADPKRRKSKT